MRQDFTTYINQSLHVIAYGIHHYMGTTEQASTIFFIYAKYEDILLVPISYHEGSGLGVGCGLN